MPKDVTTKQKVTLGLAVAAILAGIYLTFASLVGASDAPKPPQQTATANSPATNPDASRTNPAPRPSSTLPAKSLGAMRVAPDSK